MSGIFDQVINYAPPSLLKGTVTYKGAWSAATNTPTLINPPDSTTNGFYYVVSAAGTQFSLSFNIGDWIISNGSAWQKVDNTDSVDSVFGRTGAVVGVSTDYSAVGITATAVGASSPSTGAFTTLSATTPLAATSGGTGLSSLGTGVATFLGTPTSANLAAAVTNETGSGSLVFGTSPTITTPVIAQINDANGNETLKLASIASAVNEVTIENAATGNAVHISATGGDASVGLHLVGKGASGYVNVQDSTDATKRIMFNAAGGTTNTRTMLSSTQTVDRTLSLPDATDTLVGKATTDTLTNKTLTSPTITGGALNGTLGATTPSTVAGTTGTFSGAITSTLASGNYFNAASATTAPVYLRQTNTSGQTTLGTEGSTAAQLLTGSTAYGSVLGYQVGKTLSIGSSATVLQVNDAGLAITGALSATGTISGTNSTNSGYGFNLTNSNAGTSAYVGCNIDANNTEVVLRSYGSAFTTFTHAGLALAGAAEIWADTLAGTGPQLLLIGIATSKPIVFATGNTERMRIDNSGNLLIATTSFPSAAHASATQIRVGLTGTVFSQNSAGLGLPGMNLIDNAYVRNSTGDFAYLTSAKASRVVCTSGNVYLQTSTGSDTSDAAVSFSSRAIISDTGLAVTGTLSTTGSVAFGIGIQPSIRIASLSADQSSSTYSLVCYDSNGFSKFSVRGDGAVAVAGALSKGSGSFRIEHPLPSKSATHQLVHSFIEGPKCDLIYRGKVDLVDGKASVNIDADSTMTEGTFEALCATVQCFTSNESGWGAIRGKVVGNILTIEAQDAASTDNVSWMVIGERKDKHIMDTDWTDKNGRPIVEPLKPAEPALESK